jgi:uncharacterized protein (DUF342 family)
LADALKLSYNATLMRVKVELSRNACQDSESPPVDLIARAKTKLEVVKGQGDIVFFVCYESRLNEAWKALRALPESEGDRRFVLTIGAGAPLLPGIKVEKGQNKALAFLSVDAPKDSTAHWRFEWFKLIVLKRLRELAIKETPNNAQIFAVFARVRNGERLERIAIGSTTALAAALTKPYSVIANKQRQEIALVIRHPDEVRDEKTREAVLGLVAQAVKQLSEGGHEFRTYKKDLLLALQGATEGPEALGLEGPLVLLAAVGATPIGAGQAARRSVEPVPQNYPGAGKLSFNVAKDRMEAVISGFQMAYYEDPSFEVSLEWVVNELRRHRMQTKLPGDIEKLLSEAIQNRQNLDGLLCCRGEPPVANRHPYLHKAYLDASVRAGEGKDLDDDQLDMREMQQRSLVKAGTLVAILKYKEAGATGRDVYGEEIPLPPDEELPLRIGEGIQQREKKFYALIDGIPEVEGASISLSRVLIHKGDVNLRSGNIRFDGPIEIHGSIDSGSVVESSGDLIVHGQIRGGQVRVKGNLSAHAGIVTGQVGSIQVKGNVSADFIENSQIVCGGDMVVGKALINSRVFVGKVLWLTGKDAVCAGGSINAKDAVRCGTLGFKHGALTDVKVGIDGRVARSIDIRTQRMQKVEKRLGEDRIAMRELTQRKAAQMTQKHKELRDELQDRLQRGRILLERMEGHLKKAQTQLSFNANARIYVRETLHTNVSVEVGGQKVLITNSVAGVCVVSKRRRGSHIVPIEEIEAEDAAEARSGADAADPRKAS